MIHTGIRPDERISSRYWTTREERVLRNIFPSAGPKACVPLLPGRSYKAIRQRAYDLHLPGVSMKHTGPRTGTAEGLAWAREWRERHRAEFDRLDAAGRFATDDLA